MQIQSNVVQSGTTVTATGSAGNNVYKFWAGPLYVVELNGIVTKYDPTKTTAFVFNGGAGTTRPISTAMRNETAQFGATGGTFSSTSGLSYNVTLNTVQATTVTGGGGSDTATLTVGTGTNTLIARPTSVLLSTAAAST